MLLEERLECLLELQETYPDFISFAEDFMVFIGFELTDIQEDIALFMQNGGDLLQVQAQRGEAKSTIAIAYCIWALIHDPTLRVIIASASAEVAEQMTYMAKSVVDNWDVLECLRPDRSENDRVSSRNFDMPFDLKGVDKSPSVSAVGATSSLQGRRADLIIADDIESSKNSRTPATREGVELTMADFLSICKYGKIIYLGTPQSVDSVYNSLPSKGFRVRIWTGRYPTVDQLDKYRGLLAPLLLERIAGDSSLQTGGGIDGTQGQPTDPLLGSEAELQRIELGQGYAYFQLQHMLNTEALDSSRFPLHPRKVISMAMTNLFPTQVALDPTRSTTEALDSFVFELGLPSISPDVTFEELSGICMYIDPAGGGQNGDETGYSVGGFLNGYLFVLDIGGIDGGYAMDNLNELAKIAKKWNVNTVKIEKNFGFGAFKEVFTPVLLKEHRCGIEEDYVTGQKEVRIIDTLEPIIGRGSLIINSEIVRAARESMSKHTSNDRLSYSFFHQLAKITRAKGALIHDDRLDSLAGLATHFLAALEVDSDRKAAEDDKRGLMDWFRSNRLGHKRNKKPKGRRINILKG